MNKPLSTTPCSPTAEAADLKSAKRKFESFHGECLRFARICWAQVRCQIYLLRAMWRSECQFTGYDKHDRIMFIGAVSGYTLCDMTITRSFFEASEADSVSDGGSPITPPLSKKP